VTRKRLDESALPAPFLGERGAQALRGSRRGNGLPDEREPVRIGGWAFRGLLNLPVKWDA
jgi:hypothetical protein